MPRIRAATVAEHRAVQRRLLLDAAREIVGETGRRPTLAAVAARVGLARPSVYEYFSSPDELLAALVEDITPRWAGRVNAEMGDELAAYCHDLGFTHPVLGHPAGGVARVRDGPAKPCCRRPVRPSLRSREDRKTCSPDCSADLAGALGRIPEPPRRRMDV